MQTSLEAQFPSARPRRFVREIAVTQSQGPKIAFSLLIVFTLMLYSSIAILVPQLNALRPVLLVAVGALVMLALELGQTRQGFRVARPQTLLLVGFVAVCAVSTFSALYMKRAFETTLDFSKIVLIYLVIENTVTTESRLRKVFWTLVIGGLFPAIGTIQNFMNGILIEGRASWIGVFKNPNEDAYCLAVLVPIAASLASQSRWKVRIALWGVIAVYVLAIYLTFSRGSLLGLVAGLGLAGWRQKSYVIRIVMIAGLVVGIVVAGAFWTRSKNFGEVSQDTTVKQRMATVIAGGLMFMDHPLLGVGPNCSIVAYPLYVPKEYLDCGCQTQLVIHNTFVQVLAELGALGFLCFMGILLASLVDARRMQRGSLKLYGGGLEIALWVFIVCSLSGGFLYTWSPYLLFGLIAAAKHIPQANASESAA